MATIDNSNSEAARELREKQDMRAHMRQRYLKCLQNSNGKRCVVDMVYSTKLSCTFLSADIHGCEFLVGDVKTPSDIYASALLRASDIVAFTMETGDSSSENPT